MFEWVYDNRIRKALVLTRAIKKEKMSFPVIFVSENLEVPEILVNTHTHTHTHRSRRI